MSLLLTLSIQSRNILLANKESLADMATIKVQSNDFISLSTCTENMLEIKKNKQTLDQLKYKDSQNTCHDI